MVMPETRIAVVRKAFEALIKDPVFIAGAKKRKVTAASHPADELKALEMKTVNALQAVIAKTGEASK